MAEEERAEVNWLPLGLFKQTLMSEEVLEDIDDKVARLLGLADA